MNKARRTKLENLLERFAEIKTEIEAVGEEEQEAFENMPENLQLSKRGQRVEGNADILYYVVDHINEIEDWLNEVIN